MKSDKLGALLTLAFVVLMVHIQSVGAQAFPPRGPTRTPTATSTATRTATPVPTQTPASTATVAPSPTAGGTAPALIQFGASYLCWGCADELGSLTALRAAGMGTARQRCTYAHVTDYACSDAVIAGDNARGLRTILVGWFKVTTGGRWAPGAGDCSNAQLPDITTLYANLATRYRGNNPPIAYQLDNEPDYTGCVPAQSDYVDTFVAAHRAITAADPDALVVIAGLAYEDTPVHTRAWSNGLYTAIALRVPDMSHVRGAVHIYDSYVTHHWGTYPAKISTARAAVSQAGAGTPTPPWVDIGATELGENAGYYGRAAQATAVARAMDQLAGAPTPPWVMVVFQGVSDPNNPEFGLRSRSTPTVYPAEQAFVERLH